MPELSEPPGQFTENPAGESEIARTVPRPGPAGTITIPEGAVGSAPPVGFQFIGQKGTITAPNAAPSAPLVLVFEIDASVIPPGENENTITVFRNGVPVPACTGSPGVADPDPCVSSRVLQGDGDVEITTLTSSASDWTFAVAQTVPLPALSFSSQLFLAVLVVLPMLWASRRRDIRFGASARY